MMPNARTIEPAAPRCGRTPSIPPLVALNNANRDDVVFLSMFVDIVHVNDTNSIDSEMSAPDTEARAKPSGIAVAKNFAPFVHFAREQMSTLPMGGAQASHAT